MKKELNQILSVPTDVAAWFLFHPKDLAHRRSDPHNWWAYDFAISKEFAAGRLVAVSTGKDGNSRVRFTQVGLTERERLYTVSSADFRLRVQHQSLYLDGGNALPADECQEIDHCDPTGYGWIELPNGNYRVIVHAIAWYEEPGALDENNYSTVEALAGYVVHFQPVADLATITPPTTVPNLDPILATHDTEFCENADYYCLEESPAANLTPLPWSEYPILQWSEVIFPYAKQRLDISGIKEPFALIDWHLVTVFSLDVPTIGTMVHVDYCEGDWETIHVEGLQVVRLNRIFHRNDVLWAEVEPYNIPDVPADLKSLEELKRLFANYSAYSAIALTPSPRIKHPHFYAEQIAALTDARELGWRISHALNLTSDRQQELLTLSEQELIQSLLVIMSEAKNL